MATNRPGSMSRSMLAQYLALAEALDDPESSRDRHAVRRQSTGAGSAASRRGRSTSASAALMAEPPRSGGPGARRGSGARAAGQHVGELAEQRVDDDAQQHDVGLQELARVHGHVADAGRGRDRLGDDQGQPHDAQRVAQADQDRGQGARQDHPAEQRPRAQAVGARHLDQRPVDMADAVEGVEVDREQDAGGDQEQLGLLVDAEPEDDQRDRGQMRDVAQHLQRGIEQPLGDREHAVEQAQREAQAAADGEPDQRALRC